MTMSDLDGQKFGQVEMEGLVGSNMVMTKMRAVPYEETTIKYQATHLA